MSCNAHDTRLDHIYESIAELVDPYMEPGMIYGIVCDICHEAQLSFQDTTTMLFQFDIG